MEKKIIDMLEAERRWQTELWGEQNHSPILWVNIPAYDKAGNRGVSFWLNAIQVTRRGEPLGRRDEDDFGPSTNDDDCPFD